MGWDQKLGYLKVGYRTVNDHNWKWDVFFVSLFSLKKGGTGSLIGAG